MFPFKEGLGPHTWSEFSTQRDYQGRWSDGVKQAETIIISSPADLEEKIEEAADETYRLECSYLRQDDKIVGDSLELPPGKWKMSSEDVGKCIEKAASLTKGAALWATER